jgi:glycosyltransferase involved in cell wall biosynthesis
MAQGGPAAKPRIVFVAASLGTGGAERQTVRLAKQLRGAGYDCRIFSFYDSWSASTVDDDTRTMLIPFQGTSLRNLAGWPAAWSAIASGAPDIIVVINPSMLSLVVAGRLARRLRARIVAVHHSTLLTDWKNRLGFPAFRMAARLSDCLVFVSAAQRDYWTARRLRAGFTTVIHNGVDTALFDAARVPQSREEMRQTLGFDADDFVIGISASFRPVKNLTQAVDALAILRDRGIKAKLLLVGDGPTRRDVEARAAALSLTAAVTFAGEQVDVRPWVKAFDVGLLCSKSEAFSMAALEVMSMGAPMVMPDVGGCAEILDGERGGLLFEVGNTDELADCLARLAMPAVRALFKEAARGIVREQFSEAAMVGNYEKLFAALCPDPARGARR